MKTNDRELPHLDRQNLNSIFEGVYGVDLVQITDEQFRDFLDMLYTLQHYNYRYRPNATAGLLPLFEKTVGPMELNSEGTKLWLALGLAIKELYGMRNSTLKGVLGQITARK